MPAEPRYFDLDEIRVEKRLIDFDRTIMEDEQKKIAMEMSKFLSRHIGVSHNVLLSFLSLAISMWQAKEKMLIKDINNASPEIRFQHVTTICKHFKDLLIPVLKNKVEASDLGKAIDESLIYYKQLRDDIT